MSTITTRAGKGSPLTNTELDTNFTNLNNEKVETSEVVTTAAANKLLKLDASGNLPTGITGNAATATTLQTARTIGGVSFNGSANINLPGVNTAGNQNTTGSAAKWTTARTLSYTGDATGSGSVDGSANVATALTLANSGVTAGTYTKVTVDAKGRATSGTTLAAADIPALDASKITSGVLDAARLPSYVDDVLEYANLAGFPATGETGKIYVALDTNKTYRWSGSAYVYITSGAVDSVAGKTGVVTLVKGDVGLGSVDNTADSAKNVLSATKLTTARTIGGVSFDGTANINLPGVNAAGNQSTTGNAATATKLATAVTIGGVSFDGSASINLPGVNAAGNQSTTGNAATATKLATARTLSLTGDVTGSATFDGSGNAAIAATIAANSVALGTDTTGNYMANVAAGTGISVSHTQGEGSTATIGLAAADLTLFPTSNFKKSVKVATTANITLSAPQTIDGVAVVAGDRVLVKNQTTAAQNGIYIVNAAAWTRSTAADGSSEIDSAIVGVDQGTTNGGRFFTNTFKTTDTLGTTAMPWYEVVYNSGTWAISTTGNAATATTATTALNTESAIGSGTTGLIRITNPTGGDFRGGSTTTGAIKVALPLASNAYNSMLRMRIEVWDYSIDESFTMFVAGYVTAAGAWSNQTVTIVASNTNRDFTVRFGNDGTRRCFWIGELTSPWSYLRLYISELEVSYNATALTSTWDTDWVISAATAFDTVEDTITNNLPVSKTANTLATARTIGGVSFDGSANINLPGVNTAGNQSTTGNAATATKLATARTINGVAFDGTANITISSGLPTTGGTLTGDLSGTTFKSNRTSEDARNTGFQISTGADIGECNRSTQYYDDRAANCNGYLPNGNCAGNSAWNPPNGNWWTWGVSGVATGNCGNPWGYDFAGGQTNTLFAVSVSYNYDGYYLAANEIGGDEYRRNYRNCNCGQCINNCFTNCNCNCNCDCNCQCK